MYHYRFYTSMVHTHKCSPEGWSMTMIKSDVRQGSKRTARDIQDIIVADDGYGAPKMDGKGMKIARGLQMGSKP